MAQSPFDAFALETYPRLANSQAWNTADVLLAELGRREASCSSHTLVVNDEFGALCVATEARNLWTDSWLAQRASQLNLARNQMSPVTLIWAPDHNRIHSLDCKLVLLRVPKNRSFFEYQLSALNAALAPGVPVIAAGMDKHLFTGTAQLMERYIGPTERHRGQRKARSFRAVRNTQPTPDFCADSEVYSSTVNGQLLSFPNVFSHDKIDIGSRFLIEHMKTLAPAGNAIDLACGSGILGLCALKLELADQLLFCDESAMAIAATKINARRHFPNAAVRFHHGDGLLGYDGQPADLIICNPPFHHNHRVDSAVGKRLLIQSARYLKRGGRLCIVANRHLDYLPTLKREFSTVERIAQDAKFMLWLAHR